MMMRQFKVGLYIAPNEVMKELQYTGSHGFRDQSSYALTLHPDVPVVCITLYPRQAWGCVVGYYRLRLVYPWNTPSWIQYLEEQYSIN